LFLDFLQDERKKQKKEFFLIFFVNFFVGALVPTVRWNRRNKPEKEESLIINSIFLKMYALKNSD